jgi:cytochrome c oxidase assembly protein subunit 15
MLNNKNYNNFFRIWLIKLTFLVSLIIIVGGLTRLTNSGLSITEWELFKGIFPPTNDKMWISYFESYKEIPQYLLLNSDMNLDQFKYIFLWEYSHRLLARFIGIFFLIPFLFFLFINLIKKKLLIRLILVLVLILLQGAVGWFMVKSGLVENTSVSHYRLSIHLFIAFTILSILVWTIYNFTIKKEINFFQLNLDYITLKILLFFIFIQIIFGAFVSGLDAGKVYQSWPLMNESYFPDDITVNNFFNLNEPGVVQFLHRNIAYLILLLASYSGFIIFKNRNVKQYKNFFIFFSFILVQIILGISVLITGANIYLASMHQISSIFLVIAVLRLYHSSIRY